MGSEIGDPDEKYDSWLRCNDIEESKLSAEDRADLIDAIGLHLCNIFEIGPSTDPATVWFWRNSIRVCLGLMGITSFEPRWAIFYGDQVWQAAKDWNFTPEKPEGYPTTEAFTMKLNELRKSSDYAKYFDDAHTTYKDEQTQTKCLYGIGLILSSKLANAYLFCDDPELKRKGFITDGRGRLAALLVLDKLGYRPLERWPWLKTGP